MSIKISNLTIKINKKSMTLSLEEAKDLFNELNSIFGPRYNYNTYPFTFTNGLVTSGTTSTYNTSEPSSTDITITNT